MVSGTRKYIFSNISLDIIQSISLEAISKMTKKVLNRFRKGDKRRFSFFNIEKPHYKINRQKMLELLEYMCFQDTGC